MTADSRRPLWWTAFSQACGLRLPAPVQQVVISAAVKVYLGTSASVVPATNNKQRSESNAQLLLKVQQEMRVMLRRCRSNEAENTSGTNSVEVTPFPTRKRAVAGLKRIVFYQRAADTFSCLVKSVHVCFLLRPELPRCTRCTYRAGRLG